MKKQFYLKKVKNPAIKEKADYLINKFGKKYAKKFVKELINSNSIGEGYIDICDDFYKNVLKELNK